MSPSAPIHVLVVAPAMLCWGFERLVRTACLRIRLTGTAPTLAEGLELARRVRVDVTAIDFDEGYAPEALAQAAQSSAVLLLTSLRHPADLDECRRVGVSAVVPKRESPEVLVQALVRACRRRPVLRGSGSVVPWCERVSVDNAEQVRIASLTTRERQMVMAVLGNATAPAKVIADRLCISEHTLRNHLSSIYGKLGLQNRLSLHAYAERHHLNAPGFLET